MRHAAPYYAGAIISCTVQNSVSDKLLWEELNEATKSICQKYDLSDINKLPAVLATRQAYKSLGKDPNRYRPSAEALLRRVLKDKSLYQINTLVDLINLVSIQTGLSINGYDEEQIVGETVTLDAGVEGELFRGIGRGELNIAGLPVFRDAVGAIGTPTSDEERTKLTIETKSLLIIINSYSGTDQLDESVYLCLRLLNLYAAAVDISLNVF